MKVYQRNYKDVTLMETILFIIYRYTMHNESIFLITDSDLH